MQRPLVVLLGVVLPVVVVLGGVVLAEEPAPVPATPPQSVEDVVAEVDRLVAEAWTQRGQEPALQAGDAEILRRLHLDLKGRLPTTDEARAFLADEDPDKRAKTIDTLVASEAASLHFGEWYGRLLLGRDRIQVEHRRALEAWLASEYGTGRPFHEVAGDLIAATGPVQENGAGAYMAQFAGDVPGLAGRTARLFLGVRVQCAQCHDHPWDEWKQEDFHGFAAYFTRTVRQKIPTPVDEANGLHGRGRRHVQTAKTAIAKLEKEIPALKKQVAELTKAVAEAEKALKPLAVKLARLDKPLAGATERTKQLEALVKRAKEVLTKAEARRKAAPKALARELEEQKKTAKGLADLTATNLETAKASLARWQKQRAAIEAQAGPLRKKRDLAKAKLDQAKKALAEKEGLLKTSREGLAQAEALEAITRDLAALAPGLYSDAYASDGKRVPPPAFRVVDRAGKVRPRQDPKHPERGDGMPRPLQGQSLAGEVDGTKLRTELAAWVQSEENPFFAKAVVNRLAARLLGQGFVDPVDDLSGPGERFAEAALDHLADDFRASGYDLRRLLRVLVRTEAYQLTSAAPAEGAPQMVHARVKELSPQVAYRALVAALLPGVPEAAAGGAMAQREALLRTHGALFDDGRDLPATKPQGGIRRALFLMNGRAMEPLFRGRKEGLAARLAAKDVKDESAIEEVFLALLTRPPTEVEREAAKKVLPPRPAPSDKKRIAAWRKTWVEALEDLTWALVNGPEFLTNH